MGKENREVKNSVLVDLMYEDESAEENERSFYNALHEEPLPEGTEIKKLRVDNVVYMNFKNDFSFKTGDQVLVLGEHQSTLNNNMPLRELMYIGRVLEQLIPTKDRYKKGQVSFSVPEFYTLYKGKDFMEKEKVLKLSDAFEKKCDDPMLELKVRVININPGAGHELLDRCPVIREYSEFIEVIRKYQEQNDTEPYKHAIEECIEKGILADYLKRKGSEVVNMLTAEYDYETDIEVQREEARVEGRAEGRAEGKAEGKTEERSNLIKTLYEAKFTIDEISRLLKMEEDVVEKIVQEK
nr:hypothetical protein [uncultured Dorea sp.]